MCTCRKAYLKVICYFDPKFLETEQFSCGVYAKKRPIIHSNLNM